MLVEENRILSEERKGIEKATIKEKPVVQELQLQKGN